MSHDLVVRGGLVATATDAVVADLGIRGGRIATIDQGLPANGKEIDARGLVVMPGGVDVHTHLDLHLGGARTADDFESGTAAAACGGVTTICDYAWQKAGDGLAKTIETWKAKARGRAHVDYGFHVILSDAGDTVLEELPALVAAGFPSVKVFNGFTVQGVPRLTLSRGEIIARDGHLLSCPGRGHLVLRERQRG
jgi:dihydropyrimidinase